MGHLFAVMIVFLLGLMDLIAAGSFLFVQWGWFGTPFYIFIISYLGIKAIAFRGDIASILDGFCAGFLILMLIGLRTDIVWIPIVYLLQKSLFSLKDLVLG